MPEFKRSRLSLIVVEYTDGRVAVQALDCPPDEAERLFDECRCPDADIRISLVHMDLRDTDIMTKGRVKTVSKSVG
jgi:hypothetical protein